MRLPHVQAHCPTTYPWHLKYFAKSFDNQMIKHYLIIKSLDLLSNLPAPDVEPPLKFYTCEAAEDSAQCFLELKQIFQGTKAEV